MRRGSRTLWLLRAVRVVQLLLVLAGGCANAAGAAESNGFSFGVIGHTATPAINLTSANNPSSAIIPTSAQAAQDKVLREAIRASDADSLAFVVANGIKAAAEPCSDQLLFRRKEAFQDAKNGLIVSIAGSDWSDCHTASGRSVAIERLNRVRELFFADDLSFGASKLPLARQASTPRYRAYGENLRWEVGNILFATIHLPGNNNDFLAAAGRNSEFDDRMFADRDWLHRIFGLAAQKNAVGIVLFCDANPLEKPDMVTRLGFGSRRDGYVEIRKQILARSQRFAGKVLLVYGADAAADASAPIAWQGNLGTLGVSAGWRKITVEPSQARVFQAGLQPATLNTAAQ
jgi:hypothetical protein